MKWVIFYFIFKSKIIFILLENKWVLFFTAWEVEQQLNSRMIDEIHNYSLLKKILGYMIIQILIWQQFRYGNLE